MAAVVAVDAVGKIFPIEADCPAVVLPSGQVTLVVEARPEQLLELDGVPKTPFRAVGKRWLVVDLARSVGFHCLTVGGTENYSFATEDGKAALAGVQRMLAALDANGLSWGNQLFLSDGRGVPNNVVVVRWLQRYGAAALNAVADISVRPRTRRVRRFETAAVARPPFDIGRSVALFRKNSWLLEERSGGVVTAFGRRYTPRSLVTSTRKPEVDTPANRKVKSFASKVRSLCATAMQVAPMPMLPGLRRIDTGLAHALAVGQLSHVRAVPGMASTAPSIEEMRDARYSVVMGFDAEIRRALGWSPALRGSADAFVKYSDEIFQAFVTLTLAAALDLKPLFADLRPRRATPSFANDVHALYYDTHVPRRLLTTWRSVSVMPDEPRPDICLVEVATGRVVVIDAKYREKNSEPTSDSLSEVQYYLNTLGLTKAGLLYPSAGNLRSVEGFGFKIVAVPVVPSDTVVQDMRTDAVPALLALLDTPKW